MSDIKDDEVITTNGVLLKIVERLEKRLLEKRLQDIENMLDSRSPTLREAVHAEQKLTCSKDDEHDHMRNDLGLGYCPECGVSF